MATSAFKSTSKRTPVGSTSNSDEYSSSNRTYRRSRSLSRFSRRLPEPIADFNESPALRGNFVNAKRGSGFPEISLDDLELEFFPLKDPPKGSDRGRSSRRVSEVGRSVSGTVSQRRGRSASRHNSRVDDVKSSACTSSGGGRVVSEANLRRRRSLSVVRHHFSDRESDLDPLHGSRNHFSVEILSSGNSKVHSLRKPTAFGDRRFGRSLSQKCLSKSRDGYSSQSSVLTDDEGSVAHSGKHGIEKTIRAVYTQKKPAETHTGNNENNVLYEVMRKELRNAVEEIRSDLGQVMASSTSALEGSECLDSDNSKNLQAFPKSRRGYAYELEQSEKRKQDLLVEILLEDERGRELSKIVRELRPDSESCTAPQKPLRARKRSNDRRKISKHLAEEAEKCFEEFMSNIEDTDISSFDGERSDTSSSLGGISKPRDAVIHAGEMQAYYQTPVGSNNRHAGMDGVILPWLQWETNNEGSSLSTPQDTTWTPLTPKTLSWDTEKDLGSHTTSSHGSCSTGLVNHGNLEEIGEASRISKSRQLESYPKSQFDADEYLSLQHEDLLFERWKERQRIDYGGLLLCSHAL